MSGLAGDLLLGIGVAAAGFASSYLTNRRSQKTDRAKTLVDNGKLELDNRREDGAAYERASEINQQIVNSLRDELTALQATVKTLRTGIDDERRHSADLENKVHDLESTASALRSILDDAKIAYPVNLHKEQTP